MRRLLDGTVRRTWLLLGSARHTIKDISQLGVLLYGLRWLLLGLLNWLAHLGHGRLLRHHLHHVLHLLHLHLHLLVHLLHLRVLRLALEHLHLLLHLLHLHLIHLQKLLVLLASSAHLGCLAKHLILLGLLGLQHLWHLWHEASGHGLSEWVRVESRLLWLANWCVE